MRDLPAGTVTFLFTDIEGSTRLLEELGDRYPEALGEHRRVLRAAFKRHGGVEVDTQGDAFFVAFPDAREAVAAAVDGQRALADGPVQVRMGLHTGEPIVWAEGYAGLDVHRGARICAAAHGGQVVVSERTRAYLDGQGVRDLGLHRLKDLSEPQPLFQVGDGEFPPLKTLHATNLPAQPSPLVGRGRELDEVGALLRENRVVTLTGPGGSGKTRLALHVAADAAEDFPHGVYWVPLQAVGDPELVVPAIAGSLGAAGDVGAHIGDRRLLLLLDNFEQVVEAAPALADLLARCANARMLLTSREALRIAGERRYAVEPLPDHDAVALFTERARTVELAFEATPAVEEICRRLDGLPLAVELAAARVGLLRPEELLARLERALPLLTLGARDAPERQRTLGATIAWSHDLLTDDERRAFRRLAVFAGSFELEAAETVCSVDHDAVQSLLDKSLVRRWESGRFGMLATIHEYAAARLEESNEDGGLRRRHAEHYLEVARGLGLAAEAADPPDHAAGGRELENFRAALAWALENDAVLGLELALALAQLWATRDPFEGARWLEALPARAEGLTPELRARADRDLGGLLFLVGSFNRAEELYEKSLAAFRRLADERSVVDLLQRLAIAAFVRDDHVRVRAIVDEGLAVNRRAGSRKGEAHLLYALANTNWAAGDGTAAVEQMTKSAEIARAIGDGWWEASARAHLAEWAMERGDPAEAERHCLRSVELARAVADRQTSVYALAILARLAAERGDLRRAGLLWGVIEAEEERATIGQWEHERAVYAEAVLAHDGEPLRRGIGEGRRLTLDEGMAQVLATAPAPSQGEPV